GIRDKLVTGVQTCALPISGPPAPSSGLAAARVRAIVAAEPGSELARALDLRVPDLIAYQNEAYAARYARFVERVRAQAPGAPERSEERRVGEECGAGGWPW